MIRLLLIASFLSSGIFIPEANGQLAKLPRPDSLGSVFFGGAVAIDGDWAIVGATGDDRCGLNAGSAWVYRLDGSSWKATQRLEPSVCEEGAFFGKAVALDGKRIAVSAFRTFIGRAISNHVYVFELEDDVWTQTARLSSPDRDASGPFASSIDLDGDRLLITSAGDASGSGANGKGFVFRASDDEWSLESTLVSPLPLGSGTLGTSAAMDGRWAVVSGSTYSRQQPGFVAVYRRDGDAWSHHTTVRGVDGFFIDVDIRDDLLLIGESRGGSQGSGSANLLRFRDDEWQRLVTLRPKSPYAAGAFGTRVALGNDVVLVSGFDEQLELDFNVDQVVYVIESSRDGWRQRRVIDVGESAFGAAIALDRDKALIGQAAEGIRGHVYMATIK
ncbi:MAG: hypothetical protein ACPGQT_01020 [Rhodothermales bacterium]